MLYLTFAMNTPHDKKLQELINFCNVNVYSKNVRAFKQTS